MLSKMAIDFTKYGTVTDTAKIGSLEDAKKPQGTGTFGTGFQRGAGKTFFGLGRLAGKAATGIGKVIPGEDPLERVGQRIEEGYRALEPHLEAKPGEELGMFTEQVAEFAIPAGKVAQLTKGKALVGRMAAEGITGGAVATAQEGKFDNTARDIAILSAIFPGAGALLKTARVKIGTKAAPKIINSLIKPLKRDMSFGKNPGRGVAAEKIIASSLDDLESKIGSVLDRRINELNALASKSDAIFDVSKTLQPIDDAIDKAVSQNRPELVKRLEDAKKALSENLVRGVDPATGRTVIQSSGMRNLTQMSAEEAVGFKRAIGDITAFTGNPSDDKLVNSALKRTYGRVKEMIVTKIPESSELSERVADLISARTAAKYRAEIAARQNLIQFTPKVLGGAGLAGSIFSGNPIPAIVGMGAAGLEKALGTPAAKTRLAKWLASASREEKRQLFQKAPWARGIIQEAMRSEDFSF
jgi:hypothetical protein